MSRVPVVTSLPDARSRQRRYLIMMAVCVVCFVASPLLHGPLRGAAVAVALVTPPLAAIVANRPSPPPRRTPVRPTRSKVIDAD